MEENTGGVCKNMPNKNHSKQFHFRISGQTQQNIENVEGETWGRSFVTGSNQNHFHNCPIGYKERSFGILQQFSIRSYFQGSRNSLSWLRVSRVTNWYCHLTSPKNDLAGPMMATSDGHWFGPLLNITELQDFYPLLHETKNIEHQRTRTVTPLGTLRPLL